MLLFMEVIHPQTPPHSSEQCHPCTSSLPFILVQDFSAKMTLLLTTRVSDSENSDGEEELVPEFRVLLQTALESAETLMQFLEREDDTSFSEIILLRKIRMNIRKKLLLVKSRKKLTDTLNKHGR